MKVIFGGVENMLSDTEKMNLSHIDWESLTAAYREYEAFLHELEYNADRAVVLVLAARIEDALQKVLSRRLGQAKVPEQRSFASALNLAYDVGAIDHPSFLWLASFKTLRNKAAHQATVFELSQYAELVDTLRAPFVDIIVDFRRLKPDGHEVEEGMRGDFKLAAKIVLEELRSGISRLRSVRSGETSTEIAALKCDLENWGFIDPNSYDDDFGYSED